MDVGVAILAALTDAGKYRFDMTFGAGDRLVHSAQRILRLVVIEFRNGANRLPRIRRMAVLARDIQVSVRTVRATRSLRTSYNGISGKSQK